MLSRGTLLALASAVVALSAVFAIGIHIGSLREGSNGEMARVSDHANRPDRQADLSRQDPKPGAIEIATARDTGHTESIESCAGDDAPLAGPADPPVNLEDSKPHETAATRAPESGADLAPAPTTTSATDELARGFALTRVGYVRQISAAVLQPASTWFEITAEGACTTGTCQAAARPVDHKLNTSLIWSATPEAAAEKAQSEGKLVFLIHVSGNFAQPGFT
jgi:hypothetical protein